MVGKKKFLHEDGSLQKNEMEIMKKTIPLMFNEGIYAVALTLVFRNYCVVNEAYIPAVTVVQTHLIWLHVAFMDAHAVGNCYWESSWFR